MGLDPKTFYANGIYQKVVSIACRQGGTGSGGTLDCSGGNDGKDENPKSGEKTLSLDLGYSLFPSILYGWIR